MRSPWAPMWAAVLLLAALSGEAWASGRCLDKCTSDLTSCSKNCDAAPCFNRCNDRLMACQKTCGAPPVSRNVQCYDAKGRARPCSTFAPPKAPEDQHPH